ncbi:MAG: hypothetical protein JWL63_1378 [Rhodocyclales bacterium]|nr:hypothetical protein [Rhodocyclales bacterium]
MAHKGLRPHFLAAFALMLLLASCGGSDLPVPGALKSINISKMECPIASDGATIPPGTNSKVKAYAIVVGIDLSDIVWAWDADGGVITFGSQSQRDNTSTIDITAPASRAKFKINVHATADGKRADSTCELEVN